MLAAEVQLLRQSLSQPCTVKISPKFVGKQNLQPELTVSCVTNIFSITFLTSSLSFSGSPCDSHVRTNGKVPKAFAGKKTIPKRLIVAGDAYVTSSHSKSIRRVELSLMRSPFGKHSV